MFDAFEVMFDNSGYPQLVIAENFEKAIEILGDSAFHMISITRLPKYDGRVFIQGD